MNSVDTRFGRIIYIALTSRKSSLALRLDISGTFLCIDVEWTLLIF